MIVPAQLKRVTNYATALSINDELGSPNFVDVTVPAFKESKTVVSVLGLEVDAITPLNNLYWSVSVVNSTTVRVRVCGSSSASYNVTVNWQLIEYA